VSRIVVYQTLQIRSQFRRTLDLIQNRPVGELVQKCSRILDGEAALIRQLQIHVGVIGKQ
jgi:uncharacterized Fe-S cluster-containing protein